MDAPRLLRTIDTSGADVVRTDEDVLNTLVAHNGIVVRAAAMLNMSEADIMGIVSRNLASLSAKLRGRVMLSSFVTVLALDGQLQANVADLGMDTLGRTYAASLSAFTNLAGQFEEKTVDTDTDDAEAAKTGIIERLERMGKREEAARALESDEAVS